jgi:hypothetical protein
MTVDSTVGYRFNALTAADDELGMRQRPRLMVRLFITCKGAALLEYDG